MSKIKINNNLSIRFNKRDKLKAKLARIKYQIAYTASTEEIDALYVEAMGIIQKLKLENI